MILNCHISEIRNNNNNVVYNEVFDLSNIVEFLDVNLPVTQAQLKRKKDIESRHFIKNIDPRIGDKFLSYIK